MPISGKMYVWGDGAKHVPEGSGVYALYNEAKVLVYIGESTNLRENFTYYLETNFSDDHRKRESRYYKREFASKQEDRMKELLDEYRQKHGELPKCNLPPEPPEKEVARAARACPRCGIETSPVKTWKMAGRPSKTGERLQLTIGHYKCLKCNKTFRRVIAKEKIKAS